MVNALSLDRIEPIGWGSGQQEQEWEMGYVCFPSTGVHTYLQSERLGLNEDRGQRRRGCTGVYRS